MTSDLPQIDSPARCVNHCPISSKSSGGKSPGKPQVRFLEFHPISSFLFQMVAALGRGWTICHPFCHKCHNNLWKLPQRPLGGAPKNAHVSSAAENGHPLPDNNAKNALYLALSMNSLIWKVLWWFCLTWHGWINIFQWVSTLTPCLPMHYICHFLLHFLLWPLLYQCFFLATPAPRRRNPSLELFDAHHGTHILQVSFNDPYLPLHIVNSLYMHPTCTKHMDCKVLLLPNSRFLCCPCMASCSWVVCLTHLAMQRMELTQSANFKCVKGNLPCSARCSLFIYTPLYRDAKGAKRLLDACIDPVWRAFDWFLNLHFY